MISSASRIKIQTPIDDEGSASIMKREALFIYLYGTEIQQIKK